jgi:centromere protein I
MRSLSAPDNLSQNALGCLASPATYTSLAHYANTIDKEVPLPILFGLPHNSVTCLLADRYLRELEDQQDIEKRHRGPVTQRSLDVLGKEGGVRLGWTEYRVGILGYMNGEGVTGIGELMRVTVKGVIDSVA